MKRLAIILTACGILSSAGAFAQDDEIVVTGSRISSYESDTVPVVHLKRRADFMVIEVIVESDSRDAKLRKEEVFKTLTSLAERAARDSQIDLGIVRTFESDNDEIQFVEKFDRTSIRDAILSGGGRQDTTRATILAKTPISTIDTRDAAYGRLEEFIKGAQVAGRATVAESGDAGLSIVDIDQYRAQLLAKLAEDNASVRTIFGDQYRVSVSGFEKPVRWRVTGPLNLAIYFPYYSSIAPQ